MRIAALARDSRARYDDRFPSSLFTLAVAGLAFALPSPSQAVSQSRRASMPGGSACQLSIPTTDTGVRPKATGFRNEGSTNAFVICGIQAPDNAIDSLNISFYSLDGAEHTFNCTAYNGWPDSDPVTTFAYSTKSVTAGSTSHHAQLVFGPADFGGGGSVLPYEGYVTVTCLCRRRPASATSACLTTRMSGPEHLGSPGSPRSDGVEVAELR